MDGTNDPKDALGATPDPLMGEKGTPTAIPETLTRAEATKMVSDALSKAGRDAKTLSELKTRLDTGLADLTAKQTAWQRKQEEAEEEAVMDNPGALATLRAERKRKTDDEAKVTELAERETKLTARETELADIVERDRILQRTELAAEVAVEKGVSIDAILKLAKADTREAYLEVAAVLPPTKEPLVIVAHSGRTNRGSGNWHDWSADEKIRAGLRENK